MASSIILDPVAAALTAVRDHFTASIPGLRVVRGIQELGIDQTGAAPEMSMVELTRDWEELTPTEVDKATTAPGVALATWKVAQLRIQAQIDFWTPYRVAQDLFGPLIEAAFYNRLPQQGGLFLDSFHYHGRPLVISRVGAGINQRDSQDVAQGSWRRTWTLEILTDLVVQTSLPIASEILIDLSTQLGPDTVTEPDLSIT